MSNKSTTTAGVEFIESVDKGQKVVGIFLDLSSWVLYSVEHSKLLDKLCNLGVESRPTELTCGFNHTFPKENSLLKLIIIKKMQKLGIRKNKLLDFWQYLQYKVP